ncbi:helix-turn-helix domain-containing protein [Pelagibacterium sp.]|uniref:helix-turn-helix domain-containing protein n=1 Tax=Pelagibacterium sp. TaxID=1967288 RepID=UPI003C7AE294
MVSYRKVEALSRGLTILRYVNEEPDATVGSLHAKSGLDKATIVRMLETLEHEGYVTRGGGAQWRVTGRTILLSGGYSAVREMGRLASPILSESREILKWPASFGIFDRDAMIIADTTHDWRGMMVTRQPNHRPPMLTTSLGRAYLAFMDDRERNALLDLLRRDPTGWNVMANKPGKIRDLIADIRAKGYAVADNNYMAHTFGGDIWGMIVPVRGKTQLYGALVIMVLRRVIGEEEGVLDLAPRMLEVAPRIAEALGG